MQGLSDGGMAGVGDGVAAGDPWAAILAPEISVVVDPVPVAGPGARWVRALAAEAPFAERVSGAPGEVAALLPGVPAALRRLADRLARRFAAVTGAGALELRVEGVADDACRKLHADWTDVRLLLTLAGLGTEHAGGDDPGAPLRRVPTGHVALLKGRLFPGAGPGRHPPCLHRSPPLAGTGARRLLLVMNRAEAAW